MSQPTLSSAAYRADPWSVYAALGAGPVWSDQHIPLLGRFRMIGRYDVAFETLKADGIFCRDPANAGKRNFAAWLDWLPGPLRAMTRTMLQMDAPDHRRVRALVEKAFGKRGVEAIAPDIADAVEARLDAMDAEFADGVPVDLVAAFARPLPLTVIHELMGTPPADRPAFDRWAESIVPDASAGSMLAMLPRMWRMARYLERQFDACRAAPREGLISELVAVEDAGTRLDRRELLATVFLLLLAGHVTTTQLIAMGVRRLLQEPEHWRSRIAAGPEAATPVVEELLRLHTPVQLALMLTRENILWHGMGIDRGEMVGVCVGAANLDPEKFHDPLRFDPGRSPNRHLAFGTGPHGCLGQQLARIETRTALAALFARFPDLCQIAPDEAPRWTGKPGARGLAELWVIPRSARRRLSA